MHFYQRDMHICMYVIHVIHLCVWLWQCYVYYIYQIRVSVMYITQTRYVFLCTYKMVCMHWKRRESGRNVNPMSEHWLRGSRLGRAMNLVDRLRTSADERVLSGRLAVVIVWWAACGGWLFFIDPSFLVNSHLDHSLLRARLLRLCCTAAFPPIFLQLRKGPLWSCAELLQGYALCSSDQSRTIKLRLPAAHELFWGMLGRGDGGWRGIGVSGSGYNEVLALEVGNVVWLRRTKETCKASCVCNGSSRVSLPHRRSRRACVRSYVHFVCVCVYMCSVYVCGHVFMYTYARVYVFVHLCVYTHLYVYVYANLCIDCGSQYQCFSVWTVSCMRMCVRVHLYAYTYVCRYIYMCIFLQWVLHALYKCFRH